MTIRRRCRVQLRIHGMAICTIVDGLSVRGSKLLLLSFQGTRVCPEVGRSKLPCISTAS